MSEFVKFLHEVFEQFGPIRSRKMFGGHGIYHNDLMFALVADDELYLKADDQTIVEFERLGLTPFEFNSKGKILTMRYYHAPEDIYDDPDLASQWAQLGYDAALRAQQAKIKKNKTARRKNN
ncbi:MAG: TfoX/Sxy family protein [Arenicella sp.]|nr:TfoX/Sxy family protein [Arenicella sp.]